MLNAKRLLLFLSMSWILAGQTRAVALSWTASTSTGVAGYTIATGASAAGPFTQIACTGTVAGSTCVAGSTASTTSYSDTQTVGNTVWYQLAAVAPACTPTTPVTQSCGTSAPVTANTTVPPRPTVTTVVVVVQ